MPLSTDLPTTKADGDANHTAGHNATNARVNEACTAVNLLPTTADVTAAVAAHEADTTSVHGIADTSALETTTGSAAKVSTHAAASDPHGDRAAAAAALAAHEADTTSVHGIADTAALATTAAVAAGYQPLDSGLTTIAGLTATTDSFLQAKGSAWAARTVAQVKTDLAISGDVSTFSANALTLGESTLPRLQVTSTSSATGTGNLRLTYFTAQKTETTTQVRVISGGTAAAATPTLVRIGLYLIDGSDGGTLVASTVSDTALFAATNTVYTRSWSTPYAKVAGQRYALSVLVVTGAAAPTLAGHAALASAAGEVTTVAPRLSATFSGQTDLPASFATGSLAVSGNLHYAAILP